MRETLGFYGGDYDGYCFLRCKATYPGTLSPTFRKNIGKIEQTRRRKTSGLNYLPTCNNNYYGLLAFIFMLKEIIRSFLTLKLYFFIFICFVFLLFESCCLSITNNNNNSPSTQL
jgi:hypothetical protein